MPGMVVVLGVKTFLGPMVCRATQIAMVAERGVLPGAVMDPETDDQQKNPQSEALHRDRWRRLSGWML